LYTLIAKGPVIGSWEGKPNTGGAVGSASIHYNSDLDKYYLFTTWKNMVANEYGYYV